MINIKDLENRLEFYILKALYHTQKDVIGIVPPGWVKFDTPYINAFVKEQAKRIALRINEIPNCRNKVIIA